MKRVLEDIARFARQQGSQTSTWRGLAVLVSLLGASVTPDLADAIVATGLGISALIAVLLGDRVPGLSGTAAESQPSE